MLFCALKQLQFAIAIYYRLCRALNYGGIGAVIGHEITHGFDDQGRQFDAIGNLREWWNEDVKKKFQNRAQCIINQYGNIEVSRALQKVITLLAKYVVEGTWNWSQNQRQTNARRKYCRQWWCKAGLQGNTADLSCYYSNASVQAYKAYLQKHGGEEERIKGLEQYNNEQMFFLGYAMIWCGHMTNDELINRILTDPHAPPSYRVNQVLTNQPEFAAAFKCKEGSAMNPTQRCAVW
ncbi:unnamed protein product [Cylicostephanus goldi]|uniref:Peptidase M13 C-terminal domain-containing protein n=1 Tax=Cylicostephanus goldi TaxID=71465 RepID=A0A3P6QLV0_CYLGO|nr:unnamed protein product [Cylicostephanus goldi]